MAVPNAIPPEQAVERLTEMGFFKYLPNSEQDIARRELVASLTQGYLGTEWNEDCVSRDKRAYPADSEELAEGRVGEFIQLMRDVLNREGVLFDSIEEDFQDEAYAVVIDGQRHLIHDASTLGTWGSWTISTKRLLEIVNGLLGQAGSSEKLYGIYGGNDGRAIFLTDEMYKFVSSCGLISDHRETPYPASAVKTDGTIDW